MKPSSALLIAFASASALIVCGCNSSNKTSTPTTPVTTTPSTGGSGGTTDNSGLSKATLALGITAVPSELATTYSKAKKFNRYTKHVAPNGKAIHIVAQDQVTDNQIVRARNILQHYLTNYPGSLYGANKDAVANKMTENGAILILGNGADGENKVVAELNGQPLYYSEMQVEGGTWYINQDYQHRDAMFEEIVHMVHDYGIGVDQGEKFIGALPKYQAEIRAAQVNATNGKLWGGDKSWMDELSAENSLSQEYLAAVVDSYYGLWGAYKESDKGMWGMYVAKTRKDLPSKDPLGYQLMDNKFFHPYLTYNARIDESFKGNFSLKFDTKLPYTNVSQYLKDVTLTGSNDSGVVVNGYDNDITGNTGKNSVVLTGPSSEYKTEKQSDGSYLVQDMVDNRDGRNIVRDVEELVFTDSKLDLTSL